MRTPDEIRECIANLTDLPPGWRWHRRPSSEVTTSGRLYYYGGEDFAANVGDNTRAQILEIYKGLWDWAQANDVLLRAVADGSDRCTWWSSDTLEYQKFDVNVEQFFDVLENAYTCSCGAARYPWDLRCPACRVILRCRTCDTYRNVIPFMFEGGFGACLAHYTICEDCGDHITAMRDATRCADCGDWVNCTLPYCQRGFEADGNDYCPRCRSHVCQECEEYNEDGAFVDPHSEQRSSRQLHDDWLWTCWVCIESQPQGGAETFDDVDVQPADLLLVNLPHRPVRLCSIELEHNGHANQLARRLNDLGLSPLRDVAGYHSRNGSVIRVEHDSSVAGGEAIIPFLNLAEQEHAQNLHTVMNELRQLVRDDRIFLDMRCGTHIHVDIKGYNMIDCKNIAVLGGFIEDPFYRMASANWPAHRIVGYDNGYARPMPKGPWERVTDFGRAIRRFDHGCAINFDNYYNSLGNCQCGAIRFGMWEECDCPLGKTTVEFRIFNSTSSFRKMHAYVALAQSMVAYSRGKNLGTDELPAMDFDETLPLNNRNTHREWARRLEFLFQELPFGDSEKSSLIYTIKASDMSALGNEYIDSLGELEYHGDIEPQTYEPADPSAVVRVGDPYAYGPDYYDEDDSYYEDDAPF